MMGNKRVFSDLQKAVDAMWQVYIETGKPMYMIQMESGKVAITTDTRVRGNVMASTRREGCVR